MRSSKPAVRFDGLAAAVEPRQAAASTRARPAQISGVRNGGRRRSPIGRGAGESGLVTRDSFLGRYGMERREQRRQALADRDPRERRRVDHGEVIRLRQLERDNRVPGGGGGRAVAAILVDQVGTVVGAPVAAGAPGAAGARRARRARSARAARRACRRGARSSTSRPCRGVRRWRDPARRRPRPRVRARRRGRLPARREPPRAARPPTARGARRPNGRSGQPGSGRAGAPSRARRGGRSPQRRRRTFPASRRRSGRRGGTRGSRSHSRGRSDRLRARPSGRAPSARASRRRGGGRRRAPGGHGGREAQVADVFGAVAVADGQRRSGGACCDAPHGPQEALEPPPANARQAAGVEMRAARRARDGEVEPDEGRRGCRRRCRLHVVRLAGGAREQQTGIDASRQSAIESTRPSAPSA